VTIQIANEAIVVWLDIDGNPIFGEMSTSAYAHRSESLKRHIIDRAFLRETASGFYGGKPLRCPGS
jgi:hypothetical protein